ncbi:MAG: hypothetical protein K2M91_07945, partial [Lachnospiraceae bacterium]|nr:hypothetical protein [Lachnospiraceae bacterium]
DVEMPAPNELPNAIPQPAYTAQPQNKPWTMPPAYDWKPERMQPQNPPQNPFENQVQPQEAGQPYPPQNSAQQQYPPQNPVQQPYSAQQQYPYQNMPQPQNQYQNVPQNPYQYPYQNPQNPQVPQNANLPEDNGSNGETSRFGSVWDRTVNGNRDNGNHSNDSRW